MPNTSIHFASRLCSLRAQQLIGERERSAHVNLHTDMAQILQAMQSSVWTSAKCIATMMHLTISWVAPARHKCYIFHLVTTIFHCCTVFVLLFSGEEGDGESGGTRYRPLHLWLLDCQLPTNYKDTRRITLIHLPLVIVSTATRVMLRLATLRSLAHTHTVAVV